jgi:hypothetical protein
MEAHSLFDQLVHKLVDADLELAIAATEDLS